MRLKKRLEPAVLLLWLALSFPAGAAEEVGPPPSSSRSGNGGRVHELLPGIGRIGAEVAVLAGPSWNPYGGGHGAHLGGEIDLPLFTAPAGKVSYEILLLAGTGTGTSDGFPFPSRSTRIEMRLLQASPFGLRYTLTRWDDTRIRPYLAAGADAVLVVTHATSDAPSAAGGPVFDPAGRDSGQVDLHLGGHAAAGVEVRVSAGVSLNAEYRFTALEGEGGRWNAATAALGFHW